jgi:dolichol kinase
VLPDQGDCPEADQSERLTVTLSPEEIRRKLLHLLALLMPAGIFYLQRWSSLVTIGLFAIFAGSVIIEVLRFRLPVIQKFFFALFGTMLRKEEHFKITGSTWVIGAAFICSAAFRGTPHISFMALTAFILGDAAAALVGISIGRIKIGGKTLEGSCACFLMCLFLFCVCFPLVPNLLDAWSGSTPLVMSLVAAATITLLELIPLRISKTIIINDNLAVPVVASAVMLLLENAIAH